MKKSFVEAIIFSVWALSAGLFTWLIVQSGHANQNGSQMVLIILFSIISIPLLILFSGLLRNYFEAKEHLKVKPNEGEGSTKYLVWSAQPPIPPYIKPTINIHIMRSWNTLYPEKGLDFRWQIKEVGKKDEIWKERLSATVC